MWGSCSRALLRQANICQLVCQIGKDTILVITCMQCAAYHEPLFVMSALPLGRSTACFQSGQRKRQACFLVSFMLLA